MTRNFTPINECRRGNRKLWQLYPVQFVRPAKQMSYNTANWDKQRSSMFKLCRDHPCHIMQIPFMECWYTSHFEYQSFKYSSLVTTGSADIPLLNSANQRVKRAWFINYLTVDDQRTLIEMDDESPRNLAHFRVLSITVNNLVDGVVMYGILNESLIFLVLHYRHILWLNARLWYPKCVSTVYTTSLHKVTDWNNAFNIIIY